MKFLTMATFDYGQELDTPILGRRKSKAQIQSSTRGTLGRGSGAAEEEYYFPFKGTPGPLYKRATL